MSPEPLNTVMPGLEALAEEFRQTAQAAEVRPQNDPLRVNDRVAALKRALAPDVEDLIFADGDIIAWRMREMMSTETVHRTAVYLERRQLWFWGNGNVLGPIEKLLIRLRCEGVSDICYIPARARIPLARHM
jgi:hypothetical protein